MTSADSAVRFLHLSDLHLMSCPKRRACGPHDRACHVCIKASILDRLGQRITSPETRPQLLLLTGDLTERRDGGELRDATAPLDRFVRLARENGIAVAGITGEHDGDDSTAALRKALGWDWLLRTGDVNHESGVAVYGVEGRPKRTGTAADLRGLRREGDGPSVVLLHEDASILRAEDEPRFDYYALGHLHRGRILQVRKGSRAIAAYPGHLFSYWDGDGKSWPVHVVEGSIAPDGTVTAKLLSLSEACGAPETRRMYINHADSARAAGTIVFENAPPFDFFVEAGVEAAKADDEHEGRDTHGRIARMKYGSRAEMHEVLRRVVDRLPKDVFVSPSTGEGWRNRFAYYGAAISASRFAEFVEKTFKRSANTQ